MFALFITILINYFKSINFFVLVNEPASIRQKYTPEEYCLPSHFTEWLPAVIVCSDNNVDTFLPIASKMTIFTGDVFGKSKEIVVTGLNGLGKFCINAKPCGKDAG